MAINLSKEVGSNLLSLQATAAAMAKTQERLATGLKLNSALDNPTPSSSPTLPKRRITERRIPT